METEGKIQKIVKVSPQLAKACVDYGVSVTETCRKALLEEVIRRAGNQALAGKQKPKKEKVRPWEEGEKYCTKCHQDWPRKNFKTHYCDRF